MNQPGKLLTNLIEEYLQKNGRRLKWSTRYWKKLSWSKMIAAVGDKDTADFSYNDAEDFVAGLYEQRLSIDSVRSYVNAVRTVFNWAWRRGYRQGDPFAGLKLPKSPQYEIRIFSQMELQSIIENCSSIQWKARIMTAATAGLRKSEVLNLTVNDVDFEKGYIKVQPKRETQQTWPWTPKSYECRRVPLTNNLANIFTNILADEIPAGQPYLHLTEKRYWHLQQLRAQGRMPERMMIEPDENYTRPFLRILQAAGVEKSEFHDLRRTCITNWTYFLPPQEVKILAGHADIKTTMAYYAGVRADVLQRATQGAII